MQFVTVLYQIVIPSTTDFRNVHEMQLDAKALYQNFKKVALVHARVCGTFTDSSSNRSWGMRIAGVLTSPQLNPTFNYSVSDPLALGGVTITPLNGIALGSEQAFYTHERNEVPLPVQMIYSFMFDTGSNINAVVGDIVRVWFTIGYDILKEKQNRFERI